MVDLARLPCLATALVVGSVGCFGLFCILQVTHSANKQVIVRGDNSTNKQVIVV